jgi:hypothetical protein
MTESKNQCNHLNEELSENFKCSKCGKRLCKDCAQTCNGCEATICEDCGLICPECNEIMCEDCMITCNICGESYCESCAEEIMGTCSICEEQFCTNCGDVVDDDSIEVDKFGSESVCERCSRHSSRRSGYHRRH